MSRKRAAFYIDGFNLYHALDGLNKDHLKWLSLYDLSEHLKFQKTEVLSAVKYYTAYAGHTSADRQSRHRTYIAALKGTGVEVTVGRFRKKPVKCHRCQATWNSHEEKMTDVNIAVTIVRDALLDYFDVCYLISGDTDLLPAVEVIKADLPGKQVVSVLPPFRKHGRHLMNSSHRSIHLKLSHLEKCLLPERVAHNGKVYTRPVRYDPPA